MKKLVLAGAIIVAICLGAFAGYYAGTRSELKDRETTRQTLTSFAASKLEDLKSGYDEDVMEALISNVYAAVLFTDDSDLQSALHELWNALIFDGEDIAGSEDNLIEALKAGDPNAIKGAAYGIRE